MNASHLNGIARRAAPFSSNVDIDDELLQEFRKFAVDKHGRIYRVLKPEVEAALRAYLQAHRY